MRKKVIKCKSTIVIEHSDDDVEQQILRYLRSMAGSRFSYVFKNQDIRCYTSNLEIKLNKNKILKFKLNPDNQREYQIYHFVEHLLLRIFLEKHPEKFGFDDKEKKQKVIRGLDSCTIISSANNKPFFEMARELFSVYEENKDVFSEQEKIEIENCQQMMSEIKNREGKPFFSFSEVKK